MERKGFHVTKDTGCLIPDPQYSAQQHGAMTKGQQRTFTFFARWIPRTTAIYNESGCPSSVQISHLCQRKNCVRIDHMIGEEQWKSSKRIYCSSNGRSDCGNEIQCLREYDMDDPSRNPVFCQTRSEAREALTSAPQFIIHGANRFTNMDWKARQRRLNKKRRKRKQERHAYVTKRKQTRLALRANRDG